MPENVKCYQGGKHGFQNPQKYYNRFNPFQALEPDDEMNVDLDAFGDEPVRGLNWTNKLLNEILLSARPVCKLFTGLRGSGKTTDLKRLARRLADSDIGNFLPVFIDAEEMIDLSAPIEVTDIISTVIHCTAKTVAEAKHEDPEKALEEGYHERFWNWVKNTDVHLTKSDLTIPSVGKLVMEMKTRPSFRKKVRNIVAANFSRFIKDARDELELLENSVKNDLKRDGIVIIFDSLEKLRGLTDTWHDVLASADKVFRGSAPYVKLPVHVLYTVPAALAMRIREIDFLPMIKVRDKENNSYPAGIAVARELIRKRAPDDIIKTLLGDSCETLLEKVILRSGGYPREILIVMQNVIAQERHPVSEKKLDTILMQIANQYQNIVLGEMFDWLARVSVTKKLTLPNEEQSRIIDLMLQNQAVQRYLNDELWFDLHPAVRDIPGVVKAIKQLEAESENGTEA